MENNSRYDYNYNHGDYCHGNCSEEPVYTLPFIAGDGPTVNMEMSFMNQRLPFIAGDGPTVNMEMSFMNQSENDDHSGGQEETRGSRLCCVM